MRTLAAQSSLPSLVVGDFNEILSDVDKSGDPYQISAAVLRFRETLVDCGLSDMSFVGSRFTWSDRFTKERLDRACNTSSWNVLYPCSRAITLPPTKSNHSPLLIEVSAEPMIFVPRLKGFRF